MKLDVKAFALTYAIVWGGGLFLATWWIIALDGSSDAPTVLSSLYRGYSISPVGSLIGLVWATVDGLVGGAIIAWLYNRLRSPTSNYSGRFAPPSSIFSGRFQ